MARKISQSDTGPKRIAAVALAVFVVILVALSLALFNRAFDSRVQVTVESDRAGLVMDRDANVRSRGVTIGHVADISQRDGKAVLELEVDPDALDAIPANSPVRIGSNTIFGAKNVDFETPAEPSAATLEGGTTVRETSVTTEVNTLFENLTELLQATEPEKLNATLGALATALDGRGDNLGETITNLNSYLGEMNPHLDTLQRDLAKASVTANIYADATPDIMRLLDAGTDVGNTLLQNQAQFERVLVSAIGTAETGKPLLDENGDNVIKAMRDMRVTTSLLAEYSPMISCMIVGLNQGVEQNPQGFGGTNQAGLAFKAGFQQGSRPYRYPDDLPKVNASTGPNCYGLPFPDHSTNADFIVTDTGSNPVEGMPDVFGEDPRPLFGPLDPLKDGEAAPPTLLQVMLGLDEPEAPR